MKQYVALDCSLKQISVCVMTEQRRIVTQAVIAADAGSIAEFVRSHAPEAEVIGLESGPTSPWLFHALRAEGLPVVVIDARHAKAVLSLRINKTDRNDAVGLAELLVSGWYKPVTVKSLESHRIRTVLTNRALLVGIRQIWRTKCARCSRHSALCSARGAGRLSIASVNCLRASACCCGWSDRCSGPGKRSAGNCRPSTRKP